MNITLQLDITSVKAMQTQLSTQMIPVAFARALNKTAQSAQSTVLKIIAQAIGNPQKVIKPFLSRRDFFAHLEAILGKPVNLPTQQAA